MHGTRIGSGLPNPAITTRLMSWATSGLRACDRTCPSPAKQPSTAPHTKSTATIRLWHCCRWSRPDRARMGRRDKELSTTVAELTSALGPQHVQGVLQILRVGADDLHLPPVGGVR